MRREDFWNLMEDEFGQMQKLNKEKGHDYAGDEDALANFKEAAERLGITPFQVWAVYADKHWSAVMTYCKEGQVASEPIEGRVRDILVYGMLLLGLIDDCGGGVDQPPEPPEEDAWSRQHRLQAEQERRLTKGGN